MNFGGVISSSYRDFCELRIGADELMPSNMAWRVARWIFAHFHVLSNPRKHWILLLWLRSVIIPGFTAFVTTFFNVFWLWVLVTITIFDNQNESSLENVEWLGIFTKVTFSFFGIFHIPNKILLLHMVFKWKFPLSSTSSRPSWSKA